MVIDCDETPSVTEELNMSSGDGGRVSMERSSVSVLNPSHRRDEVSGTWNDHLALGRCIGLGTWAGSAFTACMSPAERLIGRTVYNTCAGSVNCAVSIIW